MALEGEIVGSVNLVITDPSKPVGYQRRVDNIDIQCSLVIVGPQFVDPPAPTEIASPVSERPAPEEQQGADQRVAQDADPPQAEAVVSSDDGPPPYDPSQFESAWKADEAYFAALFSKKGGPPDAKAGDSSHVGPPPVDKGPLFPRHADALPSEPEASSPEPSAACAGSARDPAT
eukprot:4657846-Pyramimonas_sp.AAC.1